MNDHVVKKSYKLKDQDNIQIDELQRYLDTAILDEAPHIQIPIMLEKNDYLVINKPKGVLSHPNSVRNVAKPSVVGRLYHRYNTLPSIGNFIRAGLIHRLDKDTDGLMIVAKTERGLQHFKHLFQQKSQAKNITDKLSVPLHKYYRASCVVTDQGRKFLDQISSLLPWTIKQEVIANVPHTTPKMGITVIESIDFLAKDTVKFFLHILTGRTHQIRYHLSAHGLPIVGDYLYGIQAEVQMQLTAWKLEFEDTEGENICLEISPCEAK